MNKEIEIKKFYVDTRFKTKDSVSDSDFNVQLPRQFNVPENVVAYIDDIVIPVCWRTVDSRNSLLYMRHQYTGTTTYKTVYIPYNNYTGDSFAIGIEYALHIAVNGLPLEFRVAYSYVSNELAIDLVDNRANPKPDVMSVTFFSDESLKNGAYEGSPIRLPQSINGVIRLTSDFVLHDEGGYNCYLDLHTTRNLYLISSALASYDTVSNFGNDTIIKKIPVHAAYNEILFDAAGEGYDYLNVSRRTLRYIDFKLVDSYFNVVDMQNTHWSFSIVFQRQN